jgi:hypothetical protein
MINELTTYQAALYLGIALPERGRVRMTLEQYQYLFGGE